MSGAEAAIAGIGFLCNAMQIVTFGRDILQAYRQGRNEQSPDPRLKAYLESAKACFDDMNSSASRVLPSTRDQQQIIDIGKKLEESMTQLQSKFSELHIDDASRRGFRGKVQVGKKSLASLWQGKELESLEVNLKRYESLLHGVVLHRICNQSQAAEISSQQSFHQLNTNLQSVIKQLADGRTWMSEISIESRETINRITQEHETTRAAINTGFTTTNGALSSFRDSVSREFQDMAQRDQSKTFEQEHNQLLQSLRFPEMNSRRNHISENCPGTFDWIFKNSIYGSRSRSSSYEESVDESIEQREENTDDEDLDSDEDLDDMQDSPVPANTISPSGNNHFPTWLESDAKRFWISGKPASGKSSLMKFLATHPLTLQHLQAQHSNIQILTHYFWKPGQLLQKNIEGMMRSILHQVLHKNRGLAQRLWTEQPNLQDKRDGGDWNVNELKKALCWALKYSDNTFCIFLDGMDEAKEFEDLPWGDRQNTQVIYDLLKLDNVKLCASSREEDPFCRFFTGQPCLRTHQLNEHDIYHYAKNKLEVSGLSSDDRCRLLRTVVQKANGVFLWVVLAVESLNQAIRSGGANEFEERLAQTPSDLHDLLVDMWERPGDDAKLSSYNIEAARFFSLALTAIDIENGLGYYPGFSEMPLLWMRSLLVMAIALEDKPITSIWSAGREVRPDDLQARCEREEARLKLVSRGLLEVTTPEDGDFVPCVGTGALGNYALKRVEFIHRCAFDFITDTQFGRECLALCRWSSIEQAERLLASYLVKSRFLSDKPSRYHFSIFRGETTVSIYDGSPQLALALDVALNWSKSNMSFRNSMIQKLEDWQQCGLFLDHLYWSYPIFSRLPSNPTELEFLENSVRAANSNALIIDLLNRLSIIRLAEAIPVLLCALVDTEGYIRMKSCLGFIDYILTRLEIATDEGWQDSPLQVQQDVRNAVRLLHSWFVIQCLHRLSDDWSDDGHTMTDLLCRFSQTLCSKNDWHCPLILEFGVGVGFGFSPQSNNGCDFPLGQYTVAIGNFVTAYRLLDQLLQDGTGNTLHVQPPQDAKERFEILLIKSIADPLGTDAEFFSPATKYHLDIANCIRENLSERDAQIREKRWSVLWQNINAGLEWIGKDRLGYCIREVNKRGLEQIHPWVNAVIYDDLDEE